MCYAIPAKLVEINGNKGVIDYFGEKRNILLDDSDISIGDYLYAQGGIFVRKIEEKEALEILDVWKDIFFELKKVDDSLSKIDTTSLSSNALNILQKVNVRKTLNRDELLTLFDLNDPNELKVLYEISNHVRQKIHGNSSCIHGIIEFSNYCSNYCLYCGIRKNNKILRYRMTKEEILEVSEHAVKEYGFKALVLQSGEDYFYDDEMLGEIVSSVKKMGVLVFLSLGSRSIETYKYLYEKGARSVLLRFESSNENIFNKLRPNTFLKDRIQLIKSLKKIGYIIATGFIQGLPSENKQDVINNIMLTKSFNTDMYSFGPLIPSLETPLKDAKIISMDYILKTIAISRLADPNSNILVTTALETFDKHAKKMALLSGANSLMINVTPLKYKKLYNIYDNRAGLNDSIKESIEENIKLLFSLGRSPTDIGDINELKKLSKAS